MVALDERVPPLIAKLPVKVVSPVTPKVPPTVALFVIDTEFKVAAPELVKVVEGSG